MQARLICTSCTRCPLLLSGAWTYTLFTRSCSTAGVSSCMLGYFFARRMNCSMLSASFSCWVYRYPLFLPVQIRRTGEVDILRALAACQGQGGDFQSEAAKIRPDLDADNPHIIRAGKGHRLTFALITLMGSYSNTKPRERRFSLGVCTRTQRLIQSQDKSSFQPYQTADCMFCGGSPVRLAAFLSAQRQHRHKPCVYGYDCRHAALFPLCHV